jgi:SRSO17 transposase
LNNDTNAHLIPCLIDDVLGKPGQHVDNVFSTVWENLGINKLIEQAGFKKRTGFSITESVFLLVLWKWVNVPSISKFCQTSLDTFSKAKKDVMYDLLKREDINWRGLNAKVSKSIYQNCDIAACPLKVYVLDDSIKKRRGKKMEGVSSHYDHTEGRHVMGQQVLTLGLASNAHFMPLDSQIYVSKTKAQGLIREFKDNRSIVAKRYEEATQQTKPEIAKTMLSRAKRQGIQADYLAADAWFGTKPMIQTALTLNLTAILRMKKNKLKYHVQLKNSKASMLDAKSLYQHAVKGEWKKVRGMPYRAVTVDVELDVEQEGKKDSNRIKAKLLFVRGISSDEKVKTGKKDWAIFLTTDRNMSLSKILEIYALRWGIEVYFKEAKQHLGFLKEQTWTFASHTASIHLTAIRYLLLVYAKNESENCRICDIRSQVSDQLTTLDYAKRLWILFRALISGALDNLNQGLKKSSRKIMDMIDVRVSEFFTQALQLDAFTLKMEFE